MALAQGSLFGQMSMRLALAAAPAAALVTVVTQVQSLYAIVASVVLSNLIPTVFREDVGFKNVFLKICATVLMCVGVLLLISF